MDNDHQTLQHWEWMVRAAQAGSKKCFDVFHSQVVTSTCPSTRTRLSNRDMDGIPCPQCCCDCKFRPRALQEQQKCCSAPSSVTNEPARLLRHLLKDFGDCCCLLSVLAPQLRALHTAIIKQFAVTIPPVTLNEHCSTQRVTEICPSHRSQPWEFICSVRSVLE